MDVDAKQATTAVCPGSGSFFCSPAVADAAAIMDKASADIALEKKKALNDAKDEISEIAMAIAGKVVGRQLTDADQSALVDAFINELGDGV